MPITINLLQGKLRADLEKKLDPMKIGLLICLGVGIAVVMFFSVQQHTVNSSNDRLGRLRAELQGLEPQLKVAREQRAANEERLVAIEALTSRLNKRYFWAPVLESVLKAAPTNVQITSFRGSIDQPTGDVTLFLDGIAAGEEPRVEAETFRTNMESQFKPVDPAAKAEFPTMMETAFQVEIDKKKVPTVEFTMTMKYKVASFATVTAEAEKPALTPRRGAAGAGGGDE